MVKITDDKELRDDIITALNKREKQYGKRYCPCAVELNDDAVCQCKAFRDMVEHNIAGNCHCGMFENIL